MEVQRFKRLAALSLSIVMLVGLVGTADAHHRTGHTGGPRPTPSPTVAPTPTPTAAPTPTPSPKWTLVFEDDFNSWDPSRYFVYPFGWPDTEEQRSPGNGGRYNPANISASNGILNVLHRTTASGWPETAAFCPLPNGRLSARGDLLGYMIEYRIRADRMVGYKGVPLSWPQSGNWPTDGELNQYESDYDVLPKAFTHHQGGTSGSDQDYFLTPQGTTWQDWHVVRMEWIPGQYANYFLDGVAYIPQDSGSTTDRIPNTPMHQVMQFETSINGIRPDPSVTGNAQIDYIKMWAYTP